MVIAVRPRWINGIRHSVDLDDKDGTYPVKSAAAGALGVCAEIKKADSVGSHSTLDTELRAGQMLHTRTARTQGLRERGGQD